MNIYYNNAEDPYEKKLVEMKEIKNGNIYPGWMRLTYKDENGNKKRYFSQYDTIQSILINACYINYKNMNYAPELRYVEIGDGLIIDF